MITEQTHPHFDREERTDPISGRTIADTDGHPWIQEGDPDDGLTVYFESEENMRTYAEIPTQHPEQGLRKTLSNDTGEGFDEG